MHLVGNLYAVLIFNLFNSHWEMNKPKFEMTRNKTISNYYPCHAKCFFQNGKIYYLHNIVK